MNLPLSLTARRFLAARSFLTAGRFPAATAAAAWLALAAHAPALAAPRAITLEDFNRMSAVGSPACSKDGQWVAYTVESVDVEADEKRSSLWMVSFDGTQRLRITGGDDSVSAPRFSPDGRYLSFLATHGEEGRAQLYLMDRRGGEPQPITHVGGTIRDYDWSPDGRRIVLSMSHADQAESAGKVEGAGKTEAAAKSTPIVIDGLHFKEDGEGYVTEADHAGLYLIDINDRQLKPLTTDAHVDDLVPVFSPDARSIAFYSNHRSDFYRTGRRELYLIEAHPGATPRLVTEFFAPNHLTLHFTPDGREILFSVGLEPRLNAYIQDSLSVVDVHTGQTRALAATLDRALLSPTLLSADALVALLEDDGSQLPVKVAVSGAGKVERLLQGPRVVSEMCAGGGRIALIASDDAHPPELYALEGTTLRALSAHNDALMSELELGAVEDVSFPSRDGTVVHGMIVKPLGFVAGRAYPTILWIHGGPNGQDAHTLSFEGYSPELERQWFAAHGYLALAVNYRGSSGRGAAYARAIVGDWGDKEVADLRGAVDYAVRAKLADPGRLGIGGWSYGGILTDYTIASDARFKAAIAGAGSADQIGMYGSDEYVMQYNAELGPPWRSTALWLRVSYPFFHADRIHTPTLFMGGSKDFNVPIAGGEQMYQALRTLEVPAQLVVYPGQYHVFTRPSFIRDRLQRFLDWYGRYLGPATP
jgi:dipeptidyl aminopeptidase/acylaminoacyl peptidase